MAYQKCKFCGEPDLIWYEDPDNRKADGTQLWYLIAADGSKHVCKGSQRYGIKGVEQLEAPATTPPAPKIEDADMLARILKGVNEQVDAKLGEHTDQLVNIISEGAKQLTAKRADVIKESVDQAIKAAEARIPVRHELVIKSEQGIKQVEGHPHKQLPELISYANSRVHVFMVGPAGSGKSMAAEQCAMALELPYHEASMGPNTSAWDLIGYRSPDGRYVPGVMRQPYEEGGIFMLDELDNSNPSVITTLNAALSGSAYTFPDARVKKHKDFVCIAAGNTYGQGADRLYVGRNQMDAASLDRFATLTWEYDEEAEPVWAGVDQLSWVQFVQKVRHIAFSHQMRVVISPRASIFGARLLRAGNDRNKVAEAVLWKGMSREDRQKIAAELGKFKEPTTQVGNCRVKLLGYGDNKIGIIKLVKDYYNIMLSDAKLLVETSPRVLGVLPIDQAKELIARIEAAGGRAEVA